MASPKANEIRIANADVFDPAQKTVTLKGANKDTVLWFTKEPGSGNNKFVPYWIAFNGDPFSEHVIATDPKTGKTPPLTSRPGAWAGPYTIFTSDPTLLSKRKPKVKRKRKIFAPGGGGIIIDN